MKIESKIGEDSTVWFIDQCYNKEKDEIISYAEYGKLIAYRQKGGAVIDAYFGMFICYEFYATKEECEKMIYIKNIAKDLKQN